MHENYVPIKKYLWISLPHDAFKKVIVEISKIKLVIFKSIPEAIQTHCEHFKCKY